MPGCQFKRQACTVQASDEQAGLDTPWSSSTLQMATIPLLWPRIPLPASNTNTNTPWTRTTRARWSILAPSPSTTPGTLELVRKYRFKQHQQPLHGLSPCSQSKHPTSLSLSVDVKLGLPEHHPPWPPQACSPRSVHTQHHQLCPLVGKSARADNAQQFESKSSRAKGIAFHPKR